jgi:hypothetical protein
MRDLIYAVHYRLYCYVCVPCCLKSPCQRKSIIQIEQLNTLEIAESSLYKERKPSKSRKTLPASKVILQRLPAPKRYLAFP